MKGSKRRLWALSGISLLAAAGFSFSPSPPTEASPELCTGGVDDEVRLELRPAAFSDERLEMELEVTNRKAEEIRTAFGFTVLDASGKRVLPQQAFAPRSAPRGHSVAERFTLGELTDGYYRVEARAVSQTADGRVGSSSQMYLRVQHGEAVPIEFDEWWERSGISAHGGPIASAKEMK